MENVESHKKESRKINCFERLRIPHSFFSTISSYPIIISKFREANTHASHARAVRVVSAIQHRVLQVSVVSVY